MAEFIPIPIALNFIKGKIKGLFLVIIQIDDADLDLGMALFDQDLQPLMPADKVPGPAIPDQGLDIAKRIDAFLQLLVLLVARLKIKPRIVRGRVDLIYSNFSYVHYLSHPLNSPINTTPVSSLVTL